MAGLIRHPRRVAVLIDLADSVAQRGLVHMSAQPAQQVVDHIDTKAEEGVAIVNHLFLHEEDVQARCKHRRGSVVTIGHMQRIKLLEQSEVHRNKSCRREPKCTLGQSRTAESMLTQRGFQEVLDVARHLGVHVRQACHIHPPCPAGRATPARIYIALLPQRQHAALPPKRPTLQTRHVSEYIHVHPSCSGDVYRYL